MKKAPPWLARILERGRLRWEEGESWLGWIYPYRSLRFTREGWIFLAVTMAIGFAALNTGHNLFYLVFAMLVSLVVVSGILSERAVRSLRVERLVPREVFARSATAVEIHVRNQSRARAAYAVEVRDGVDRNRRRRVGFIDRLDAGAERRYHSVWSFERRGRHRFLSVHLVTRFPFGIFEKTRIVPLAEEFLVYPAVHRGGERLSAIEPERSSLRRNRLGEEMFSLRPRLPDDDRRRIHWRVSARAGELIVKEYGEAVTRPLAVFFDSRGPGGAAFDAAVERVASLLWQIARDGCDATLYSYAACFRCAAGESLRRALAFLAEIEPATAISGDSFERWRAEATVCGGGVFVTSGDPPALPPGTLLRVA